MAAMVLKCSWSIKMLDDFFTRALVAGIGVALVAGPLGCFIVWRRMAYFGDTLSHAALLGVALSLLLNINTTLAVGAVSVVIATLLVLLRRNDTFSSDALLGLLSHSALALGLVCLAFMTWVRVDLLGLLFGDILAVTRIDIALIYAGGGIVLLVLALIWRQLFAATVSPDLAAGEGLRPERTELIFMILTAIVIAISLKIIGALLITALLIIPAAAARRLSTSPEQMAALAAIIGSASVVGGLYASLNYDTPSGPSIVVAAVVLFTLSLVPGGLLVRWMRTNRSGDRP
ncbi:metal ABC transporter permease [Roseibium porphyridii]|uniref:High-affinity zinc uptake system membrane protein ZnuB n=2 Tax=Hyphomicrobiales TaxID=356 RepID=A0ABY8FF63_9HYPH|nr:MULTISPECIES: metal ABC transporter permease [Stappiaceae]WFE92505.1 metal ABC transporter permease [Roseibium sp. KMA01]